MNFMNAYIVVRRSSVLLGDVHVDPVVILYPTYRNGFMYWTDSALGLIMQSNRNGSEVTTLLRGLIRPGTFICHVMHALSSPHTVVTRYYVQFTLKRSSTVKRWFNSCPATLY
jgi:hypothetical protein